MKVKSGRPGKTSRQAPITRVVTVPIQREGRRRKRPRGKIQRIEAILAEYSATTLSVCMLKAFAARLADPDAPASCPASSILSIPHVVGLRAVGVEGNVPVIVPSSEVET